MRAIIAQSEAVDTVVAANELLAQCEVQLEGARPRAAFLFASTEYDHAVLLQAIRGRWPGLPLVGGSTDGEVSSVRGFQQDSAVLTLLAGDGFEARVGLGKELSKDPSAAIAAALAGIGTTRNALCWTVFAPTTDSSEVVRRLQEALGEECPIVGGLTGDHREYSRMVEFCNDEVLRDSLPVLVLSGDLHVSCGIGTGWFPIGEPRIVTRSDGHVVHEIDGQPAIETFRSYWGTVPADSLGEFPLAVFPNGPDDEYYLRAVLGSDPATGSIRLAGAVPQGATVRLTEVLPEGILSGSEAAAANAAAGYRGKDPSLAFVFSCAARKWVLGTQAERECDLLREAFAASGTVPMFAGGYCFGEIAPLRNGAASTFHNETCVTVLLGQ